MAETNRQITVVFVIVVFQLDADNVPGSLMSKTCTRN
jgi:hypothetical protein